MKKKKRMAIISDLHCGHIAGITPPGYDGSGRLADKTKKLRQECWAWLQRSIKKSGPFDIVQVNGDAIDGRGEKSGSRELLCVDRMDQVAMATLAINAFRAEKVYMTYGTGYHAGNAEDFENQIAANVGAECIKSQLWLSVNGLTFDFKHHVGSSGIPHGRHTAISKERLWNTIWKEQGEQPKADVFVRSHVHYHSFAGGPEWIAMTTPALQAAATIYGGRRCSGTVDYGYLIFDIEANGSYTWRAEIARLGAQKEIVLKA